ncbi:TonB-dependent receptor [Sphingomonas sp. CL5.1]|nr:TonB-dependent receptor [Sphingomonas sp. CL5.1]
MTSLRFEGNAPAFQPTLRGIGTLDQGAGVDASVAVYVDGVYMANNYGMYFNLPNVANVQVLKGPQGTLFGRNATGGAILISTQEPSDTFTGNFKASYQSYNDVKLTGYVSGPIADGVYFGIGGYFRKGDGYSRNIVTGADDDGRIKMFDIHPDLVVNVTDRLKVRLTYDHSYTFDASTLPIVNGDGYNGIGVLNAVVPGINAIIATKPGETAENVLPINLNTSDAGSMIAEWSVSDEVKIRSVTSYRSDKQMFATDADFTNLPLEYVAAETSNKSFSQEVTVSGKSGGLDWVTGVFYFNNIAREPNDRAVLGPVPALGIPEISATLKSLSVKTDAFAVFADGTYQLNDHVFLTAGGRFSSERKVADSPELPPSALIPVMLPATHGEKTWNSFTPRAVARYQFDDNANVYASFSQGFKSGAYTGFPPNRVEPEHIDAYEIGFKRASRLFDINASAFLYNYRNAQVTVIDVNHPTGSTLNAGKQRNYGFELELYFRPTRDWKISLAGAYLNATYTSFVGASQFVKGADASTFGLPGWLQVPTDATGTVVPRSPKWTGNFSTSYDIHVGDATLRLAGNVSATSSFYHFPAESFREPGYARVDLNATWIAPGGHWQVEAYATNLTNHRYATERTGGPVGTAVLYGAPRVFGGSVGFNF